MTEEELIEDLTTFETIEKTNYAPFKRHKFLRWLGKVLNVYIPEYAIPYRIKGKKCDWIDGKIVPSNGTSDEELRKVINECR